MKKIIVLVGLVSLFSSAWAQAKTEESRMFIHPFKEVFVNFPSQQLGVGVRLTVFLPEEKIPLVKSYPLVVFLGIPRSQVDLAKEIAVKENVLLALVSWEEWADFSKTAQEVGIFIQRELMPYLETNYPVKNGGAFRTLAANGARETQAVLEQLGHMEEIKSVVFVNPGVFEISADTPLQTIRFYVVGNQEELAYAQERLENAGLTYGPHFAMHYAKPNQNLLQALNFNYLNTLADQLEIMRLDAFTQKDSLLATGGAFTKLRVAAQLKNKYWFDYVPQTVRFSPPYLIWDAPQGTVEVVSGAHPGSVKIQSGVDKLKFSTKIKLKKP